MPKFDFDVIVIGAGAAGISAVKTAKGLGKKTAIVEKNRLGGECTWSGCVPSKAFIHAAERYHEASAYFGNSFSPGEIPMRFVRETIERVYLEENPESFEKAGIKVIMGKALFTGRNSITVNGKSISSGKFIVAAGSSPLIPGIEGIDKIKYYTNESIFDIKKVPDSLIILGGGPIGIELAQAFNRLGTRVTVVEATPGILIREDRELVDIVLKRLFSEGVSIVTGSRAIRAERFDEAGGVTLTIKKESGDVSDLKAEALLVAAGRVPEVEGFNLSAAGVRYSKKGIGVNAFLQTNVKNIFACGDVVGPYNFSHVAGYQGVTAGINASIPFMRKQDLSQVLWTTYTDPELSHLGLTEEEARAKYKKGVKVYRMPYSRLDRAKTEGNEDGLAKYILDRNGRLIGAHIAGKIAGELIHEAQLVRFFRKPFASLQSVMHAYPSYSDIIRQAARDAYVDSLLNNPLVKLAGKIAGRGRRNKP